MATRRGQIRVTRKGSVQRTVRVQRTVQARVHTTQRHRVISTAGRALPMASSPSLADEGYGPIEDPEREYDLFLSHASENKDFVGPLVGELIARGVRVWYDETAIGVGDSLRESIDKGLSRSRFGAVIFSHAFFAKRWTNYELNGLVTREMQGRKVVLPVWHPEMTAEDVTGYSASLADKKALAGDRLSVADIADALADLVLGQST